MKRMSFVFGVAAVAVCTALPAATVSVSGFKGTVYGPGEATLAFTGVDAAQELWVAWDDADKGADISQWKESERLGTIASGTTAATNHLPDDARLGRAVMPRSLAGEYDWILHFRTGPSGGGTGTRLCIDLNGERLATKDAPGTKTDHAFAIPHELLKAGENVFSFLNDTQSGTDSISIDSVWLEPAAPRNGTVLTVW